VNCVYGSSIFGADGWVCATPKKIVLDENGNPFQIYNFIDNRVAG